MVWREIPPPILPL
ncbi:hypothetical protein VCHE46_0268A, partial [Vibrio cholerae HE-46]